MSNPTISAKHNAESFPLGSIKPYSKSYILIIVFSFNFADVPFFLFF